MKKIIVCLILGFSLTFFSFSVSGSSVPTGYVPPTVNINFFFDDVTENIRVGVVVALLESNGTATGSLTNFPQSATLNGRFLTQEVGGFDRVDFSGLLGPPTLKVTLTDNSGNQIKTETIPLYSVPYALYTKSVPKEIKVSKIKGTDSLLDIEVTPNGIINITAATANIGGLSILQSGSDLAEKFYFSDASDIIPGMVVAIDVSAQPGVLKQSTMAYDSRVIGVVSGANGLSPGAIIGDGDHPVALAGRVWVYSDASYEAIQPGDWLASSNTPGYAMKASSVTRGGIIGKAMTALPRGQKGFVLMMVSLQ
jgi:hypothetical protein